MKQKTLKTATGLSLMLMCIFTGFSQNNPLDKCKQIAKKTGELTVCDRSQLKETVTIPLSALTEELKILKLDDADPALVKNTGVEITDNYILVTGSKEIPFKLFERKTGKFLNNIGSFGQGPNEYQNIYDQQLDEKNNRIYLLPWNTKKILVYDLEGKNLDPIPLCTNAPKGKFKVDTENATVIVSMLPFTGAPGVVWLQTTDGKLLKYVEPGHLAVRPDFSNEVGAFKTGDNYHFSIFTFEPRADSLYRYDVSQNKLTPIFTLDFGRQERSIHGYGETANYYFGDTSEPRRIDDYTQTTQNNRFYIIDKGTLKGAFFKLENDFLGNMEIEWPIYSFSNGYFVRNYDPGDLFDALEKILQSDKKLSPEMQDKLTKLKNSITDNDNNYILYAKLKE
jgi:hypothetical protein